MATWSIRMEEHGDAPVTLTHTRIESDGSVVTQQCGRCGAELLDALIQFVHEEAAVLDSIELPSGETFVMHRGPGGQPVRA